MAQASDPEYRQDNYRARCTRTLALAEAELGELSSAVARLDAVIAEMTPMANPAVCGMLHDSGLAADTLESVAHSSSELGL